jgi:hypothetical protein
MSQNGAAAGESINCSISSHRDCFKIAAAPSSVSAAPVENLHKASYEKTAQISSPL